jgi:hypothetical protein
MTEKKILQVLGKGYITKGALDTRWCHYQTLAPTQKGEKPAPGDENDREKDPLNSAFLDGGVLHRTHAVCCAANHPPRTRDLRFRRTVQTSVGLGLALRVSAEA